MYVIHMMNHQPQLDLNKGPSRLSAVRVFCVLLCFISGSVLIDCQCGLHLQFVHTSRGSHKHSIAGCGSNANKLDRS